MEVFIKSKQIAIFTFLKKNLSMLNLVFPSTISYYLSHPLGNVEIPFSVNLSKSSSNIEVLSKCSDPFAWLDRQKNVTQDRTDERMHARGT